jgi:hypothetical protein
LTERSQATGGQQEVEQRRRNVLDPALLAGQVEYRPVAGLDRLNAIVEEVVDAIGGRGVRPSARTASCSRPTTRLTSVRTFCRPRKRRIQRSRTGEDLPRQRRTNVHLRAVAEPCQSSPSGGCVLRDRPLARPSTVTSRNTPTHIRRTEKHCLTPSSNMHRSSGAISAGEIRGSSPLSSTRKSVDHGNK